MKKEKFLKISKAVITILGALVLFPLSLALYVIDRLILAVFIHIDSKNFKAWTDNIDSVIQSIYRLITALAIYGIYKFFVWIL